MNQVFDLIAGVAKTALPEPARNFLRTVIENGRLTALPEIAAQFRSLKNAQSGSSDAVVYSAFPIDGAALADVAKTLETALWSQTERQGRAGAGADWRNSRGGR